MKKEKLNLKLVQVESFVTRIEQNTSLTLKGQGGIAELSGDGDVCSGGRIICQGAHGTAWYDTSGTTYYKSLADQVTNDTWCYGTIHDRTGCYCA